MKRYVNGSRVPHYEVDTWKRLFWFIGYWQTQIRTVDFNYAASVFNEYKRETKSLKDEAILIHYDDHRGDYSP